MAFSAEEINTFEYTKSTRQKLGNIKNLAPENYIIDIDEYRVALEKYIEHKKHVCNGEFSTLVLSQDEETKEENRKKLNKEERILCFTELKALQVTFINNLFLARKKYLEYQHITHIKDLAKARDEVLKSLKNNLSRKKIRN
jgi:hypothetical protein